MATVEALDVEAARARFAALERPVSFLDGPGGSQVPREVLDAMQATWRAQREPRRSVRSEPRVRRRDRGGAPGGRGLRRGDAGRDRVRREHDDAELHCWRTRFARTLQPGDEIVTTLLDHDANVSPWLLVAQDHGLVVRQVDVDRADCTLDLGALEALVTQRTKIVAFTLASNARRHDPGRAPGSASSPTRVGALAWADAVHYAPHRRIDVAALGVDVLLCSPYKFFGPHLGCA